MRIALDSAVLIAAHISRAGACAELLEDVLLHHDLVICEFILAEQCVLRISVDRALLDMRTVHDIPIIRPGDCRRRTTGME